MLQTVAKQISELLNRRNDLPDKIDKNQILYENYFYISVKKETTKVAACVLAKKMSFFALELKHLSVDQEFERLGLGRKMISLVEEYAKNQKISLIFATTKEENLPVISLFTKLGYLKLQKFKNEKTKHFCYLWLKKLENG